MNREPNVTPMLDVMLTLIVIFIVLAKQFVIPNVQVQDPNVKGKGNPSVIALVAGPHETLWLDGNKVSPGNLAARLKGAPVEVSAQPGTSYQDVVHALDAARGAGARILALHSREK